MTPGKQTTEWKALLGLIATAIVTVGGALLKTDMFSEGTLGWVIVSALVSIATAVSVYSLSRAKVKAAESFAALNQPKNPT